MRLTCLLLVACAPAVQPSAPAAPQSPVTAPAAPSAPAALDPALEPLRGLVGSWQGSDAEHHTSGGFTIEPVLAGKVLVRRNHNDTPRGKHEDLTVIFSSPAGLRASYFDNEGHVFAYAVTVTADHVEMTSDEVAGQPRFQLRYDLHGSNEVAIDFAIAMPGTTEFKHYVGGVLHRTAG